MNTSFTHPHRAAIAPVPVGEHRPLWSVMIPTYHCADYLRETLTHVLSQAPDSSWMQIEVVDDGSTQDDPAAVVAELGQDRVQFYRQPQNVGSIRNFETCLMRSRGRLIHLLHGDDCVLPGFYAKMQQLFEQHPEIGAAYCRHQYMNEQSDLHYHEVLEQPESGILENWLEKVTTRSRIQTPSIVVRREVYETLGGFDRRIIYGEDWEMWVRIAARYPIAYEVETLARYRTHSNSITGRRYRTGENMRELRHAIAMMRSELPVEQAKRLTNAALKYYGKYSVSQAKKMVDRREFEVAVVYLREALLCSTSPVVLKQFLKISIFLLQTLLQKDKPAIST
ncbi:glycosyltransferase family 2 protein [Leptolyngbya sp. AN03gr2]|uniref:glycosyltransferase family 2 protein n=1 Tax=unclassified Leptolyngbya TaxID=2650499 RepID=UPI003D31FAD0